MPHSRKNTYPPTLTHSQFAYIVLPAIWRQHGSNIAGTAATSNGNCNNLTVCRLALRLSVLLGAVSLANLFSFFLGSLQLNQKLIAFAYYGDARVAGDFAAAA